MSWYQERNAVPPNSRKRAIFRSLEQSFETEYRILAKNVTMNSYLLIAFSAQLPTVLYLERLAVFCHDNELDWFWIDFEGNFSTRLDFMA